MTWVTWCGCAGQAGTQAALSRRRRFGVEAAASAILRSSPIGFTFDASGSENKRSLRTSAAYALAVLFVAAAFLVRWRLALVVDRPLLILFVIPILLSAYIGGLGPGLLATILSTLGADYLVLPPVRAFGISGLVDLTQWLTLWIAGILISLLSEAMRRSSRRAREAERQSGQRLAQRREEETRQAAEKSFKHERDRIAAVLDTIASLVVVLDRQGRIVQMNRASEQATGYSAAEVVGKAVWDVFILPEDMAAVRDVFASLASGHLPSRYENRWRTKRGDSRLIAWSNTTMLDEQGQVEYVIGTGMDVTEQRQAEAALREAQDANAASLAQWEAVVGSMTEALVVADLSGNMLTLNPAALRLHGFDTVEQARKHLSEYPRTFEVSDMQGRSLPTDEWPIALAMRGEVFAAREYRVHRRDTGQRWIGSYSGTPVRDREGHVILAIVTIRDITEEKRAQEELTQSRHRVSSIVNSAMDAILTIDETQRIVLFNPAAERMFRCPADKAMGSLIDRFIPQRFRDAHRNHVREFARTGSTARAMGHLRPLSALRADGEEFPIEASISQVQIGEQKLFTVILRDITERQRAEEQLRQAKEVAEEASRAKDHFLAVLSHELRTPLTPVLTTASLLEDDAEFPSRYREDLEMIRRNVELEARLIDDLLDVTRIARGKIELDRKPMPLCKVIRRAVEVCQPDIEARKLHFGVDIGDGAPYLIDADAARLQQVFWNLLKNAIKFTPNGGCVGIRCRLEDHSVIAEVSDSGEGIDPSLLPHIFNPFEQGGARVTRQFGGLGLGLTITRGLVEMHGGSITAHSEGKGKGATFRVKLPLHNGSAPRNMPRKTTLATEPESVPAESRSLRILLVEDHGDTARIMRRLLMADGHQVQIAADVATALELADSRPFDLLISDLGLPDGSGIDLIRELRSRHHAMPAIALSGYGQEEDVRRSQEAGFAEHLTKPTSSDRLAEAILSVADSAWGRSTA